jgi:hypothetical protein
MPLDRTNQCGYKGNKWQAQEIRIVTSGFAAWLFEDSAQFWQF